MKKIGILGAMGVALAASSASAFEAGTHNEFTSEACSQAGLTGSFCEATAFAAKNTDYVEFDDLTAHSQSLPDKTLCESADTLYNRIYGLAVEFRTYAEKGDGSLAASALGHAMHTIQDNCAHSGMSNPEHSWYTMGDWCGWRKGDAQMSPDVQTEALECGPVQTERVFALVLKALEDLGIEAPDAEPEEKGKVSASSACEFAQAAKDWDGRTKQWDRDLMADHIAEAFESGSLDKPAAAEHLCKDPEDRSILSTNPLPDRDATMRNMCDKNEKYENSCEWSPDGKADSDGTLDGLPWESSDGDDSESSSGSAAAPQSGGCSVSSTTSVSHAWLLALAGSIAALSLRRRRR